MTEMASIKDINMVDSTYNIIFEHIGNLGAEEVRGCSLNISAHRPRSSLMSSSEDKEEYHI